MTKHFSDFDSGAYYEQKCRNLEDKLSTANQRIRELEHELQNKQFEAQRVPVGWKLVPIYPTSDMLSAFDHCEAHGCQFAETYWDAMLAAAPKKEGE